MAKVTGVSDVPDLPGAGLIHFDDGRPPLMAMPDIADDYRAKYGRQTAMENGVAGPGSGAPDTDESAGGGAFASALGGVGKWLNTPIKTGNAKYDKPEPAPAPAPTPAPAAALPPGTRVASPAEWQQIAPPPAPAPQQAPAPAAQGPAPEAPPEAPGAPAPDPIMAYADQILARKMAGSGGGPARMTPSSEKVETTSGAPYDPNMARDRFAADAAVQEAAFAKMKAEKADYDAQAAQAAAQIPIAQMQQARAQHEVDQREQNYRTERAGLEKELVDYDKSAQVDPTRFFSGPRAVSGMMSVIGAGLGAAGATLGHTQNWAFESMQKQIQQDIDAQKDAIYQGHADRANALKRFSDYYHGDMDKAEKALGIAMNKAVSTEALRFAAQSKSKEIANNAASFAALFDQNSLKREQDLYNASLGTTKREQTSKMQGGGGAGGPTMAMLNEYAKLAKARGVGGGKDQGALGLSATAVARAKQNYGNKKEQIERFYTAAAAVAHHMGLDVDKATGTIMDPKTGRPATEAQMSPGIGFAAGKLPDWAVGEEGRALRRSLLNLTRLHAQAVYDKSITAEEAEHELPSIMGKNAGDVLQSLQHQYLELGDLDHQLDTTAASIDPRIVNERNQAKKDVNYARATNTLLAPPKPRSGAAAADSGQEIEADTGG